MWKYIILMRKTTWRWFLLSRLVCICIWKSELLLVIFPFSLSVCRWVHMKTFVGAKQVRASTYCVGWAAGLPSSLLAWRLLRYLLTFATRNTRKFRGCVVHCVFLFYGKGCRSKMGTWKKNNSHKFNCWTLYPWNIIQRNAQHLNHQNCALLVAFCDWWWQIYLNYLN